MAVSIEQIKQLREETGAGIMDCRKALEQADGDFEKAVEALREKGLATAAKRADREASEGVVELYSHGNGRVGVMVELNCETDFVGRSEGFRTLAHELALQIAAAAPLYIREQDIPAAVLEHERNLARVAALEEGKPEAVVERIVEGRSPSSWTKPSCCARFTSATTASPSSSSMMDKVASIGENPSSGASSVGNWAEAQKSDPYPSQPMGWLFFLELVGSCRDKSRIWEDCMENEVKYRRILLKLSGEALGGQGS